MVADRDGNPLQCVSFQCSSTSTETLTFIRDGGRGGGSKGGGGGGGTHDGHLDIHTAHEL